MRGLVRSRSPACRSPDLPGLDLPLLVQCGRQDATTPLDGRQEMAHLAPRARLVVPDDCGHLSPWERR